MKQVKMVLLLQIHFGLNVVKKAVLMKLSSLSMMMEGSQKCVVYLIKYIKLWIMFGMNVLRNNWKYWVILAYIIVKQINCVIMVFALMLYLIMMNIGIIQLRGITLNLYLRFQTHISIWTHSNWVITLYLVIVLL